jgi:hypothetical protein
MDYTMHARNMHNSPKFASLATPTHDTTSLEHTIVITSTITKPAQPGCSVSCGHKGCIRNLNRESHKAAGHNGDYLCATHWLDLWDVCHEFSQDWYQYSNINIGATLEDTPEGD